MSVFWPLVRLVVSFGILGAAMTFARPPAMIAGMLCSALALVLGYWWGWDDARGGRPL